MGCLSKDDTFVSPVVKYILFFFNFVCWLLGGVMIGIGVWAFIEKNKFYHKEVQSIYDIVFDLSIIFFVIGFIIFILGYAGCIGALRENICLLKFYYICMIVIFLMMVVGAVLAFVFRDKVKTTFTDILKDNLITRYHDDLDGKSTIDWLQENLYCCGVDSYKDWNKNIYFNCTARKEDNLGIQRCAVPYSCCKDPDAMSPGVPNLFCAANVLDDAIGDTSLIYTSGCVDAALNLAERELPIVGGIVIGIAVPQLFGICLARLLEGQIMDQRSRWRY